MKEESLYCLLSCHAQFMTLMNAIRHPRFLPINTGLFFEDLVILEAGAAGDALEPRLFHAASGKRLGVWEVRAGTVADCSFVFRNGA